LHLLDASGVSNEIQKKLYEAEVFDVKTFAALAANADDLRKLLQTEFGLDEAKGLADRVKVAKVVVAFDNANTRSKKVAELEGEAEARNEPKRVGVPDFVAMRQAFEKKWGKLSEDVVPSKTFMEKRLEMVEKSEFRAEPLSEVICVEDDEGDTMRAVFTSSGSLEAVRVGKKLPLPSNTEQLRSRLEVLGNSWCMAGFLHTNRVYLHDLSPNVFDKYVRYLLGKHVLGLVTSGPPGTVPTGPTWEAVLHYEHEVRKQAMRLMTEGVALKDALVQAWEDPVVRDRSFTAPLAMSRVRSAPPPGEWSGEGGAFKKPRRQNRPKTADKGEGKGGGKGQGGKGKKGKGGKEGSSTGAARTTPSGKNVCFAFNNRAEKCTKKDCRFEHVCGVCFRKGVPMYECNHNGAS